MASCAPQADPWARTNERIPGPTAKTPITIQTGHQELRETATAKVDGRLIEVALTWRDYRSPSDDFQKIWYGDMGTGRPTFVAESLKLSVDGEMINIPRSKYKRLASQWPPSDGRGFELSRKDAQLRLEIHVGDGAHAWTAGYDFDPAAKILIGSSMKSY